MTGLPSLDPLARPQDDAPPRDDPTQDLGAMYLREAQRISDRIFAIGGGSTTINQYIFVVFAAGVVAYSQQPAAIAGVPVFWSVLALQSLVLDRDTIKLSAYSRWLERRAGELLGERVARWESEFSVRSHHRPFIYNAAYSYAVVLLTAAWAFGCFEMFRHAPRLIAIVYLTLAVFCWLSLASAIVTRARDARRWEEIADCELAGQSGTTNVSTSDESSADGRSAAG